MDKGAENEELADKLKAKCNKRMRVARDYKDTIREKETENASLKRKLKNMEAHMDEVIQRRVAHDTKPIVTAARFDVSKAQKAEKDAGRELNKVQADLLKLTVRKGNIEWRK